MWTIQIDDGFCTWEYKFSNEHNVTGGTSIAEVVNAIMKETGLKIVSTKLLRPKKNELKNEPKINKKFIFIDTLIDIQDNIEKHGHVCSCKDEDVVKSDKK